MHKCPICNKVFTTHYGLNSHMSVHRVLDDTLLNNLDMNYVTSYEARGSRCVICGYLGGFSRSSVKCHVSTVHGITFKGYYDKFFKKSEEGVCENCGSPTKFSRRYFKYNRFCSNGCSVSFLQKARLQDPKYYKHLVALCYHNSQKVNANRSLYPIRDLDKWKESLSVAATKQWANPEIYAKMVKQWENPTRVKQQSELAIGRILDPNDNFGKRFVGFYQYKDYLMRSSWEVGFAQFLDKLGIEWLYESRTFCYDGLHHYTPDFYLPVIDLYIEIKPNKFVSDQFWDIINHIETDIVLLTEIELKNIIKFTKSELLFAELSFLSSGNNYIKKVH